MVEIICEKTGITFEAATRRTKNHPQIMAWLSEAYKDGWLSTAESIVRDGKVQGWTDVNQFIEALRAAESAAKDSVKAENTRRTEQEFAAKEARRQRYITNDLLRSRGYHWKKFENDEEDMDFYGAPAVEWSLWSPDNRTVTVTEAMQELAAQDVKFAHEWLAARGIAEEVPAIEKKRQEEAAKAQEQAVEQNRLEDERLTRKLAIRNELLSNGVADELAEQEAERLSRDHSASEDDVAIITESLSQDGEIRIVMSSELLYLASIEDGIRTKILTVAELLRLHDFVTAHYDQLTRFAEKNKRGSV